VPPQPIQELRDLTRARTALTRDRSGQVQRIGKVLEDGAGAASDRCRGAAAHPLDRAAGRWPTPVDRGMAAQRRTRDWPGYASCGPVGTTAPFVSSSSGSAGDGGPAQPIALAWRVRVRPTRAKRRPWAVKPEPKPRKGGAARGRH
jgi:hypothetical protein